MKTWLCCVLMLIATTARASDSIEGIWKGTGGDERYTLIFTGDVLLTTVGNHPLAGVKTSGFTTHDGQIDIERSDGLQLGLYQIEGDTLTITLANVGQDRPTVFGEKPGWKYRTYVLERK